MPEYINRDLPVLRDLIIKHFNYQEMDSLSFDLNISFEQLGGNGTSGKAQELVRYCHRHGQIDEVIQRCQSLRPHASWPTREPAEILAANGRFVFLRHRIGDWVDSGNGYEWRNMKIWISSFEEDFLEKIEKVIYHLPDSFVSSRREKINRDDYFETRTAAYGNFNISAEVFLKGVVEPFIINRFIDVTSDLDLSTV